MPENKFEIEKFREYLQSRGCASEKELPRKYYVAKKVKSDDENTAIAAISTDVIDRDKEVMLPKGMNADNWVKAPRVLWSHDYYHEPIGKGYWIKRRGGVVKAKWEWAPTPDAQQKRMLWEKDFLNTISVGFIKGKSHIPTPQEIKANPELAEARSIIDEWELLEFSVVNVPANPDALAAAINGKSITLSKELQKDLGVDEETLTTYVGEKEGTDTNNAEVEVKIKEIKKSVIVIPHRVIRPHRMVKVSIDPKDVTSAAINMLKGRIYM